MARLQTIGFEQNSLTTGMEIQATTGGGGTIQTSTVRSGTYALQISSLTSATPKGVRMRYAGAASSGPFFFRVYLRVATLPSAANIIIN